MEDSSSLPGIVAKGVKQLENEKVKVISNR
jgi:hypothetical protein